MATSNGRYIKKWATVLGFSLMAGVVGGLGAVLFRVLIAWTHDFFFGKILPVVSYQVGELNLGYALLPALGALIVAFIIVEFPDIRGNGIPEVIEAVIFKGGNIPGRFAVAKIVATAITIGSGGSVGREGPIGFIGAALTSILARWFNLSKEMKKLLVTCGLAAGIAGTFNTPLAGAMFALEVVYMGAFSVNLVPIFISSVTGNAITLAILKRAFEVEIPGNLGHTLLELPFFFLLGIILGVLAAFYARFIYRVFNAFEDLRINPLLKPVIGGLGVGFLGMFFPTYGIFGIGYEGMELAFYGKLTLGLLLTLGVVKMLATALTVGSGNSGGVFAPSLYIGTMFGVAFGILVGMAFPSLAPNLTVYALAGMAAFFSGMTQAPITQILMVTELTRSYAVLPAVMTSATMGFLTARFFLNGESIYTLKLLRKGYRVRTGRPVVLETISVGEIMSRDPVYVTKDMTLFDVEHLIGETAHDCFPVVDENLNVVGIIGIKDILKKPSSVKRLKVERFLNRAYAVTYPTETAEAAFEKLMAYDQNLLPVVESPTNRRLVGVVTKRDIYRAYYRGLEGMYID
ncbi:Voltage-gated chloride channel protein [Thermococcus kodakarensis KOD1]|uniref:Voltage-gated chloride channel protein n=1 Tax=Thermococcus kodakarensis (strain ATCC BAA-918 / JCM 12380 / KOD1) TaxID=69014 RepID=Q5JI34_THEKO|nr:chloride channel protein [Thermococcus kodakarensis]WCN28878.1 chloride channel protein [Thermococcus kodakarensis]WCN31181.1 chloride channel protein [Thermococcus kodakarensis]BAD85075.1 Voltage-gated chloride channel protein [Thermococcus kodakarensis KOD1]